MKPGFMVNTKLNVVLSVNYPVRFFLPPSIKVQVRFTILWLNPFPTFLTMAFPIIILFVAIWTRFPIRIDLDLDFRPQNGFL